MYIPLNPPIKDRNDSSLRDFKELCLAPISKDAISIKPDFAINAIVDLIDEILRLRQELKNASA